MAERASLRLALTSISELLRGEDYCQWKLGVLSQFRNAENALGVAGLEQHMLDAIDAHKNNTPVPAPSNQQKALISLFDANMWKAIPAAIVAKAGSPTSLSELIAKLDSNSKFGSGSSQDKQDRRETLTEMVWNIQKHKDVEDLLDFINASCQGCTEESERKDFVKRVLLKAVEKSGVAGASVVTAPLWSQSVKLNDAKSTLSRWWKGTKDTLTGEKKISSEGVFHMDSIEKIVDANKVQMEQILVAVQGMQQNKGGKNGGGGGNGNNNNWNGANGNNNNWNGNRGYNNPKGGGKMNTVIETQNAILAALQNLNFSNNSQNSSNGQPSYGPYNGKGQLAHQQPYSYPQANNSTLNYPNMNNGGQMLQGPMAGIAGAATTNTGLNGFMNGNVGTGPNGLALGSFNGGFGGGFGGIVKGGGKPKSCWICGQTGHLSWQCPNANNRNNGNVGNMGNGNGTGGAGNVGNVGGTGGVGGGVAGQ